MADPVVGLTNGVPTSGTGNITTLGQTLLDGANIAQGATTDAAVAAGAAGSLSAKLRSLSRDLVANIVLAAGSALIGVVKVGDGTNSAAIKPASTAAIATDQALVTTLSPNSAGIIATGTAGTPSSAVLTVQGASGGTNLPVAVAASTTDVAVTPTVTASAYTAGNVLGGIMTFANLMPATTFNGILESITAKFKGAAVTGSLEVAIFKSSPSNGTYTDKTAPTWNALDMANLLGIYTLATPNSKFGTMTVYNLDAIGKAIVGASQSIFVVVIVDGTPTPASTSDFTLELAVLPG